MITLTLLHPSKNTPVQTWSFQDEESITLGRASDNDITVYSAVVSRHHVELRRQGEQWEMINRGSNGTYVDGEKKSQCELHNGVVIRLANTGPKLLIQLGVTDSEALQRKKQKKPSSPHDYIKTYVRDSEIQED